MQIYNFICIKYILHKNIFIRVTFSISNSYVLVASKTMRADIKKQAIFRKISAKHAKNRTPATLRQRAFFGNQLKIKQLC